MSYEDALETIVTREQAYSEIEKHHADRYLEAIAEFHEDCGDKHEYTGAEVLGWLGY